MNWLFDRPIYLVILGVVVCVPIAIAWVNTGRKEVLYVLGGAMAILAALLVTERFVVTDREAIEAVLPQMARDVESNDSERVVRHIYSGAPALKQKAQGELRNYNFTSCQIKNAPQIEINENDQPRSAKVTFIAAAAGTFHAQGTSASFSKEAPIRRTVILHMRREADGRWTVEDYDHKDVTGYLKADDGP